jgi:hypothetical protein
VANDDEVAEPTNGFKPESFLGTPSASVERRNADECVRAGFDNTLLSPPNQRGSQTLPAALRPYTQDLDVTCDQTPHVQDDETSDAIGVANPVHLFRCVCQRCDSDFARKPERNPRFGVDHQFRTLGRLTNSKRLNIVFSQHMEWRPSRRQFAHYA